LNIYVPYYFSSHVAVTKYLPPETANRRTWNMVPHPNTRDAEGRGL